MPRGDRTGPEGLGQMTGRGAGFCAGYEVPGFMNAVSGSRVRGIGAGRGRGRRNQFYATGLYGWQRGPMGSPGFNPQYAPPVLQPTREQEVDALREQVKMMQESMNAAQERIEELETEKEG